LVVGEEQSILPTIHGESMPGEEQNKHIASRKIGKLISQGILESRSDGVFQQLYTKSK
jgi:hypothetical protein